MRYRVLIRTSTVYSLVIQTFADGVQLLTDIRRRGFKICLSPISFGFYVCNLVKCMHFNCKDHSRYESHFKRLIWQEAYFWKSPSLLVLYLSSSKSVYRPEWVKSRIKAVCAQRKKIVGVCNPVVMRPETKLIGREQANNVICTRSAVDSLSVVLGDLGLALVPAEKGEEWGIFWWGRKLWLLCTIKVQQRLCLKQYVGYKMLQNAATEMLKRSAVTRLFPHPKWKNESQNLHIQNNWSL